MKKRILRLLTVLGFASLFVFTGLTSAQDPLTIDDILTRLENKYTGQSFEAHFKQTTIISAVGINDEASGKVWFSHPGKMRWQYLLPHHHEFITDGKTLWFYQPLEKQVSIGSAEKAFQDGLGSAFLSDFSTVRTNYTTSITGQTEKTVTIRLIPENTNPKVKSIEIQLSKTDDMIRQVTIFNVQDDITRFNFNNIHFAESHPSMFTFTPPEGTTVIHEDKF